MASAPAISVSRLGKTYRRGWFRKPFAALHDVAFDVRRGEVFGLLGPNGAGKTTLVKVLLGIIRPTSGAVRLLDRPAGHRLSRTQVGYLPENLRIARHHTARTALDYYGKLSGLPARLIRQRTPALLASVGLQDRQHDSVKQYSKGMLQRLGLAQALLHDPELLILDEPTDGLDPVGRSHVRGVLANLKEQGKTVFVNSHLLHEVEMICDRVAVLDHGQLRAVGPVSELVSQQFEGLEVQLALAGAEAGIRAVLNGRALQYWRQLEERQFQVQLRLAGQVDVDQIVDALRRQGVSIVGLNRRRLSLEDAFLNLLANSASAADAAVIDEPAAAVPLAQPAEALAAKELG